MTLWQRLKDACILKRDEQSDVSAECARFKSDQAYQQYCDEARFNIITQLYALDQNDIDGFYQLKRSQQALDGLDNFIEGSITSARMKERQGADIPKGR